MLVTSLLSYPCSRGTEHSSWGSHRLAEGALVGLAASHCKPDTGYPSFSLTLLTQKAPTSCSGRVELYMALVHALCFQLQEGRRVLWGCFTPPGRPRVRAEMSFKPHLHKIETYLPSLLPLRDLPRIIPPSAPGERTFQLSLFAAFSFTDFSFHFVEAFLSLTFFILSQVAGA